LPVVDVVKCVATNTVPLTVTPRSVFVSPDGTPLWITSQLENNTGVGFNPTGTIAYVASATTPGTVQAVNTQDYSMGAS
jgi:DNA-binding beta-propeller fold protein YncE